MPMPPDDTAERADATVPGADDSGEYPVVYPEPVAAEPEPAVVYPEPDPDPVFCRRCGETSVPVGKCCPWCGAWLVGPRPKATPVYRLDDDDDEPEDDWDADVGRARYAVRVAPPLVPPLVVVFVAYGLLFPTLIGGAILAAAYAGADQEDAFVTTALVSGVAGAVLTAVAASLVWPQSRQPLPRGAAGPAWAAAVPVMAVLMCLNITYFTLLRELLRPLGAPPGMSIPLTWVTVLLVCVQPAVVEELFFRQMMLGVFRRSMNLHLAVWATGALFALAHIGNPLGMPYLFLAGAVFGYARAYGGLSLAVLMHFVHNFVVIAYEAWK